MFEKFTDRARRVVVLAQDEARALNHNYIGTEHILLGLIHEGEGVAAKALESLGVSLEVVRSQIEEIIGREAETPIGHIAFTPRAKAVLELSEREALELGHDHIGTEHLLLGLVREGEGVAARVLRSFDADLTKVRHKVVEILNGYGLPTRLPRQATASLPSPVQQSRSGIGANLRARLIAGKANKLYDAGNKHEAMDLYAQAAAAAKHDSTLWVFIQVLRGEFLVELDRKREASVVLRELVDNLDDVRLYRFETRAWRGSNLRTEMLSTLVDLQLELLESAAEFDTLTELAEAARASGDAFERGRALRLSADNLRRKGRLSEAIDTLNVAIAEASRVSDTAGEAHAQVAAAYIEGRYPSAEARQNAIERARRALELYEHLGDKGDLANAHGLSGRLLRWSGNYQGAHDAYSRAVDVLRSAGLQDGLETAQTELSSLPLAPPRLSAVAD
ncbi:ClpA/ClpB-like protein [Jatrophihabitans sp. GAS493]|nr:Clp protease N-terminal domain-containing protein [Jatrophihabitans sp. GAS493]SOD73537.1 ClpA/ClpB-like protein [Jatrophihabitans sp. GAS493]